MTIYQNITENAEEKTYERLFCSQKIHILLVAIFETQAVSHL